MINTVSSFYMLGVAEAEMLLQFPFLVREKGALIDSCHHIRRNFMQSYTD